MPSLHTLIAMKLTRLGWVIQAQHKAVNKIFTLQETCTIYIYSKVLYLQQQPWLRNFYILNAQSSVPIPLICCNVFHNTYSPLANATLSSTSHVCALYCTLNTRYNDYKLSAFRKDFVSTKVREWHDQLKRLHAASRDITFRSIDHLCE